MTTELNDVIQTRLRLLIELEKAIRAMRDVLEPATHGAPLETERRLNASPRALEDLDSLASQVTDLRSWRLVRDELELRAAQARMEFGQSLERALSDAGIPWTGSFPTYRVWKTIRVDVDPAKGMVRAGRRTIPIGSAAEVARALLNSRKGPAQEELTSKPQLELREVPAAPASGIRATVATDGRDFEQEFSAAYASSASNANVAAGDYVSIGKVYDALKQRMPRGYSRARFARDLADLATKTERIEFAASRHPRHGMRIPPGDGNLVGSVRLRSL